MRAFGASERVFELIDRKPAIEGSGGAVLSEVAGLVELDGVRFRYPTRPDMPVLNDVSLRVAPGEVVAVCGPSGAGKSTIASLLLRFYDPEQGAVRLDATGTTSATLDPDALRRHIGVVSQEPILFATTIAENIRYGRPDATDDEVRAAAQAANADGFIQAFSEGYGTLVGERGVRLSGGQKQRVAIARALLKDPRLLVLDEATSALDAENEHLVQEALERLMRGRTTIVIAHRLSTIQGRGPGGGARPAAGGGEQGTHAELVAQRRAVPAARGAAVRRPPRRLRRQPLERNAAVAGSSDADRAWRYTRTPRICAASSTRAWHARDPRRRLPAGRELLVGHDRVHRAVEQHHPRHRDLARARRPRRAGATRSTPSPRTRRPAPARRARGAPRPGPRRPSPGVRAPSSSPRAGSW
jgi:ABC-type polar amino acid transport system ATPase subunit